MYLSIGTTHRPATELGFLLHKHPGRMHESELPFGKAVVFYPEASDARWVAQGVDEDPRWREPDILTLTTVRSHDQYNTTIYGLDDRYRGVFGRRDVVFLNEDDLSARGLEHGDLIDVEAAPEADDPDGARAVVRGLTAPAYEIPRGSAAAYNPEMNVLVALAHYDRRSGTPS